MPVLFCSKCGADHGVSEACLGVDILAHEGWPMPQTKPAPLPDDAKARKAVPIVTGCFDYFPDALAAVAALSYAATQQHHPGQPMHWDRSKSMDHADCAGRHLMQRGTVDTDGIRHTTKLAWRALALLQLEIEAAKQIHSP